MMYGTIVKCVSSGRLALGVGDNMIRLWNINSSSSICEMTALWQGIKSKVTAVSML